MADHHHRSGDVELAYRSALEAAELARDAGAGSQELRLLLRALELQPQVRQGAFSPTHSVLLITTRLTPSNQLQGRCRGKAQGCGSGAGADCLGGVVTTARLGAQTAQPCDPLLSHRRLVCTVSWKPMLPFSSSLHGSSWAATDGGAKTFRQCYLTAACCRARGSCGCHTLLPGTGSAPLLAAPAGRTPPGRRRR